MPKNALAIHISVTDAKGQLYELVRRAEAGEEVILTRHGHAVVRLVPVETAVDREARRALLEKCGPRAGRRPPAARAPRAPLVPSSPAAALRGLAKVETPSAYRDKKDRV